MKISIITAMSDNHVIGRDGGLPWHLPSDLKRFKFLTMGHAVIMGRKTFESLGKALPGRRCIVITRQGDYKADDILVAHSLGKALSLVGKTETEVFILGGESIYNLTLDIATHMYLTVVHATINGDTLFPKFDINQWTLTEDEKYEADEKNQYAYSFRLYERTEK